MQDHGDSARHSFRSTPCEEQKTNPGDNLRKIAHGNRGHETESIIYPKSTARKIDVHVFFSSETLDGTPEFTKKVKDD